MTTPAGQRWTRSKPTEPGWYWWRVDKNWHTYVVHVYQLQGALFVEFPDKAKPLIMVAGEWLGPITPDSYQQGRVAAQQARFGAMELRAMNEPLQTDRLGYGQKALQDFADILDRLASEGA